MQGLDNLKKNITQIYDRRKAAVYAIGLKWGAIALEYFQRQQPASPGGRGQFWNNQSAYAAATVFFYVLRDSGFIALRLAHLAQYGVYLELANDRKHESLRPIIQRFAGRMIREIQELYAD